MKPHESPRIRNKSIRGDSGDLWPVWNRGITDLFTMYEGRSICNENTFITPSRNRVRILSNLFSYRLLKKHTLIVVYISLQVAKKHFYTGRKVYCVFLNKHLTSMNRVYVVFAFNSVLLSIFDQYRFLFCYPLLR